MSSLTTEQEACNYHTFRHIEKVRNYLNRFICVLLKRGSQHDQSKLETPEVEKFTELTPKLSTLTYGTDEYNKCRDELGPALEHHYAKNRHHPEHWPEVKSKEADLLEQHIGSLSEDTPEELASCLKNHVSALRSPINNMNLVDLLEMLCDWKASSERHDDGNIRKSIEINGVRFGMSDQLIKSFENSVDIFTDEN